MIKAVNKQTGEVIELPASTPQELKAAWLLAQEYEKVSKSLKDQLKDIVPTIIKDSDVSEEVDGYIFKRSIVNRMTYDKAILREVLDEDTYDIFMKPDKTSIDNYIKENLEELGELSTRLRNAMIPSGAPYQVIKLDKL